MSSIPQMEKGNNKELEETKGNFPKKSRLTSLEKTKNRRSRLPLFF